MKIRQIFLVTFLIFTCSLVYAGPTEDLAGIMRNFQQNLGPVYTFVVALSYVMGVAFIGDSIIRLKKFAQQRTMMSTNASMAKPMILFGLGLALMYFPTFVNTSVESLWVYGSSSSVLKYPSEPSTMSAFINPLIDAIRLFGLIAIVRGIVILTRLASESTQPGTIGKGLMHIIAGTLAVNIVGTVNVIRATFGF